MTATDPVQAVMDVLGCGPMVNQAKTLCEAHGGSLWHYDDGVCSAAVRVMEAARPLIAAEALREASEAWLHGAWSDTPRHADRVADRMGASQFAGDWLRERADRIEADQ